MKSKVLKSSMGDTSFLEAKSHKSETQISLFKPLIATSLAVADDSWNTSNSAGNDSKQLNWAEVDGFYTPATTGQSNSTTLENFTIKFGTTANLDNKFSITTSGDKKQALSLSKIPHLMILAKVSKSEQSKSKVLNQTSIKAFSPLTLAMPMKNHSHLMPMGKLKM